MKPFNLKAALAGKPVVTRDGRAVTQLHLFEHIRSDYPVRAVVEERIECYTDTGYSCTGDVFASDLLMSVERKSGWVNIYEGNVTGSIFETRKEALYERARATLNVIDTIEIEWKR